MLGSLKETLAKAIDGKTACLYYSGGSDSMLLLYALLELKAKFSILTFDATFSKEQRDAIDAVVYEEGLRVFSYPPANAYFIGDGKRTSFVEEYGLIDGTVIPFIRDCTGGTKCSYDVEVETRKDVPLGFEVNIFGTRKTDRHWAWGKAALKERKRLAHGEVICPLWSWTRKDVSAGLRELGVKKPKVATGDYQHCTLCLEAKEKVLCPKTGEFIEPATWSPTEMLQAFQNRFQIGVK